MRKADYEAGSARDFKQILEVAVDPTQSCTATHPPPVARRSHEILPKRFEIWRIPLLARQSILSSPADNSFNFGDDDVDHANHSKLHAEDRTGESSLNGPSRDPKVPRRIDSHSTNRQGAQGGRGGRCSNPRASLREENESEGCLA